MLILLFLLYFTEIFCDKSDDMGSRIYGGSVADDRQYPYMGYLLVENSTRFCGVSVIHSRWILTAAHCLYSGPPKIILGTNKYKGIDGRTYFAEAVISHEGFVIDDAGDDIGLVRLKTAIQFDDRVHRLKLPDDKYKNYQGSLATLSGWGSTSEKVKMAKSLKQAKFHIVPIDVCDQLMDERLEDEYFVCVSNEVDQQACPGDSGSPLVLDGIQIGVLSMALPVCDGTSSSAFTRVSAYMPWIQEQLAAFGDKL